MKHPQRFLFLPALAALVALPAIGQERGGDDARAQDQEEALRLPTYVRAAIGPGAVIQSADGRDVGVVVDHVIDQRSGTILFVALQSPSQRETAEAYLVPYGAFAWEPEERQLVLTMSDQDLDALPLYHRDRDGMPISDRANDHQPKAGDPAITDNNLLSTRLLGSSVVAGTAPFASVGELVIEPNQGNVAFVLASSPRPGSDPFVIPWQALSWEPSREDPQRGRMSIQLSSDELLGAPTLKGGDPNLLKERATLEKIYAFFEISPPVQLGDQGQRG